MRKRPKIIRTSQLKEHISKMVMEQGLGSGPMGGEASRSIFDAADALVSIIDRLEATANALRRDCAEGITARLPEKLDLLLDTRRIERRVQDFHDSIARASSTYEGAGENRFFDDHEKEVEILDLVGRIVTRKLGK